MSYWLVKTEPGDYSFGQLLQDGTTRWSGVSNNLALQHLRRMKTGDKLFIYHSGKEKSIVGIAEVISDPYPDPDNTDTARVVIDVRAVRELSLPVTLGQLRARKEFASHPLITISRLSVMPFSIPEWKLVLSLSQHM